MSQHESTEQNKDAPILVVADTHGHCELLREAIFMAITATGRNDLRVVTLGDYCDNGPEVPELLQFLCDLQDKKVPGLEKCQLFPILGNHDIACTLALGEQTYNAKKHDWWSHWALGYMTQSMDMSTPMQYGAYNQKTLQQKMPQRHKDFLHSTPWVQVLGRYVFVHGGMRNGPLAPQIKRLRAKNMANVPAGKHLPQVNDRSLSRVSSRRWGAVVLSGHNKMPDGQDVILPHRLNFHSGTCLGQALHCAILDPHGDNLTEFPPTCFQVSSEDTLSGFAPPPTYHFPRVKPRHFTTPTKLPLGHVPMKYSMKYSKAPKKRKRLRTLREMSQPFRKHRLTQPLFVPLLQPQLTSELDANPLTTEEVENIIVDSS